MREQRRHPVEGAGEGGGGLEGEPLVHDQGVAAPASLEAGESLRPLFALEVRERAPSAAAASVMLSADRKWARHCARAAAVPVAAR